MAGKELPEDSKIGIDGSRECRSLRNIAVTSGLELLANEFLSSSAMSVATKLRSIVVRFRFIWGTILG